MRAVPVGGQLTAHPPKQRTRTAGSVPLLEEMPHISNISNVSNRYSGCEVLRCFWSGATVSILQKVSWPRSFPSRSRRARPVRYRGPALEGAGYEPHELKKKRTPQRQHTPWEQPHLNL